MTTAGVDDPAILKVGDDYWAEWPAYMIRMRFSGLHDGRDGALRAELTILLDIPNVPVPAAWTNLDLADWDRRSRIADGLRPHWVGPGAPPWRELLSLASYQIRERFRQGEPAEKIGKRRQVRERRYALWPFLPEDQITILYGDGASLKSMIAMSIGLSVGEGTALLPATNAEGVARLSRQGPALYLDYETNADEQNARMRRIAAGFGRVGYADMIYRECHIPLWRDAMALRALVDEHDCRMVIVDSLGAALGGDPNEATVAIAAMTTLRSLSTTVLCIDHVTKTDEQGKPIGSAYKFNYARSAWYARRVQDTDADDVRVALIHKKSNNDKLVAPIGYNVHFEEAEDSPITISRIDIRDDPELAQHTSVRARIEYALRRGPVRAPALQENLKGVDEKMKPITFTTALRRLVKAGKVIVLPDGSYALAHRE